MVDLSYSRLLRSVDVVLAFNDELFNDGLSFAYLALVAPAPCLPHSRVDFHGVEDVFGLSLAVDCCAFSSVHERCNSRCLDGFGNLLRRGGRGLLLAAGSTFFCLIALGIELFKTPLEHVWMFPGCARKTDAIRVASVNQVFEFLFVFLASSAFV